MQTPSDKIYPKRQNDRGTLFPTTCTDVSSPKPMYAKTRLLSLNNRMFVVQYSPCVLMNVSNVSWFQRPMNESMELCLYSTLSPQDAYLKYQVSMNQQQIFLCVRQR